MTSSQRSELLAARETRLCKYPNGIIIRTNDQKEVKISREVGSRSRLILRVLLTPESKEDIKELEKGILLGSLDDIPLMEIEVPVNAAFKQVNEIRSYLSGELDLNLLTPKELIQLLITSDYFEVNLNETCSDVSFSNVICASLMSRIANTNEISAILQSNYEERIEPYSYYPKEITDVDSIFVNSIINDFSIKSRLTHNSMIIFKDHSFFVTNYIFNNIAEFKENVLRAFEVVNLDQFQKYQSNSTIQAFRNPESSYYNLPENSSETPAHSDSKDNKEILFVYMKYSPHIHDNSLKSKEVTPHLNYRQQVIFNALNSFSIFPMENMRTCLNYDLYSPSFSCLPIHVVNIFSRDYDKIFDFGMFNQYCIVTAENKDYKKNGNVNEVDAYMIDTLSPYRYWKLSFFPDKDVIDGYEYFYFTKIEIVDDECFILYDASEFIHCIFHLNDLDLTDTEQTVFNHRCIIKDGGDGNEISLHVGNTRKYIISEYYEVKDDHGLSAFSLKDGNLVNISLGKNIWDLEINAITNNFLVVSGNITNENDEITSKMYIYDGCTLQLITEVTNFDEINTTIDDNDLLIIGGGTAFIININKIRNGENTIKSFKFTQKTIKPARKNNYDNAVLSNQTDIKIKDLVYLPLFQKNLGSPNEMYAANDNGNNLTILDPSNGMYYRIKSFFRYVKTHFLGINNPSRYGLSVSEALFCMYENTQGIWMKNIMDSKSEPINQAFDDGDIFTNIKGDTIDGGEKHLNKSMEVESRYLKYNHITHRGVEFDTDYNMIILA